MTNTPDRIFLNFGPYPGDDFKDHSEVTWCTDKINESDVEYVRAEPTTDEITFLEGLKIWLPTHKITDVENRIKQLNPPPPETIGEAE